MATGISGSMSTYASTYIVAEVDYSETYDVASNASSVTASLWYKRTNSYAYATISPGNFYVKINGTDYLVYSGTFTIPGNDNNWHKVGEKTVTGIAHNADGSKTIAIGGSHSTTATNVAYMNFSMSENVALTTIPRASEPTVSKSAMTLDGSDAVVIYTNRQSDSFTHSIKMTIGSNSYTVNNVGSSYTFQPTPSIWLPHMTEASQTATATCTTYSGTTQIGSAKTVTFTVNVTAPGAPTSVTVTDGNEEDVYNGEMVEVYWSGATGAITGYEWQRSVNEGTWTASTATTDVEIYDSIPEGTSTIQYRVRAVNDYYSSDWATSNILPVESNTWGTRVLSGTLNTNKYSGDIGLTLQWSATQSVANNTSTISWTLKSNGGGTSSWWNTGPVTVKINGTTVLSITSRFKLYGGGAWSKTGSLTISHNEDGSKSFAASISAAIYSNAVNCTASGTFTLNSIARTPTAPTACSITAGQGSYVGLGDTVTISWSGATGVITGYDLQYSRGSSGWLTFKSVTSGSTSGSTTDSFTSTDITINGAGCAVQYRVRAKNGSLTSGWKTSNTLTISGAMDIKVSGAWKTGSTWIKVNGTWKRAKRIWIKVNGTWQQSK